MHQAAHREVSQQEAIELLLDQVGSFAREERRETRSPEKIGSIPPSEEFVGLALKRMIKPKTL